MLKKFSGIKVRFENIKRNCTVLAKASQKLDMVLAEALHEQTQFWPKPHEEDTTIKSCY